MKTTHKTLLWAALVALFALPLFSCTNEKLLSDLEDRVSQLETLCARMQTNLDSAAPLLEALASQDYITDVTPLTEGQNVTGYIIKFAHGNPITIYNGANGKTPDITIRQAEDGNWYWNVNDRWMRDDNGDKIPARGITPKLKVEGGAWYASFDGGKTWESLEVNSGTVLISRIEDSGSQVVFVLSDGSRITLPKSDIIPVPDKYFIIAPNHYANYTFPLPEDGRTYRATAYVVGYDSSTQNRYGSVHQQFFAEMSILRKDVHSVDTDKFCLFLETPQVMPSHFEVHVDVFSKGPSDEEFRIAQSINLPFERLITDNNKPEVVYVSSEAQTIVLGAQTNVEASTIRYYEHYDWISIDKSVTTRADLHTENQYLAFTANTDRLPRMAKVAIMD